MEVRAITAQDFPFSVFMKLCRLGRGPWTGRQYVARPVPTRNSNTLETQIYIHALSWIRTQDYSVRERCLSPSD
jgi:hypothetical protein